MNFESLKLIGGGHGETGEAEELVDNLLPSETPAATQQEARCGRRRPPPSGDRVQPRAHSAVTQDRPLIRCQRMCHEQVLLGAPPGLSASVASFGRGG